MGFGLCLRSSPSEQNPPIVPSSCEAFVCSLVIALPVTHHHNFKVLPEDHPSGLVSMVSKSPKDRVVGPLPNGLNGL